jgi:hypothetical protein
MAKRKAGSQIGSLIPDHEMSGIDLISVHAGGVQHTWKVLDESYDFASDLVPIRGLSTKL